MSAQLRPEERLLPLFWAVDGFKTRQEDWSKPLQKNDSSRGCEADCRIARVVSTR
jgi:hypothetical protein